MHLHVLAFALCALPFSSLAHGDEASPSRIEGIEAPNVVVVSDTLVTAGQPTAASLADLSRHGYKAVIYLAPPTVPDAIANEPELVRGQGIAFVNIPIVWANPEEKDFESFVAAMKRFDGQKVLVHCQANMRASAMTFLYRVIAAKEDPAHAYETMRKVWTPQNKWRDFVNGQLERAGVAYRVE